MEFHGRLDSIGALAMLRFLRHAHKTGRLRFELAGLHGEVFFDNGNLIAARYADERGMAALGVLLLSTTEHEFVFDEGLTPLERNVCGAVHATTPAIALPRPRIRRVLKPVAALVGVALRGLIPAAVLVVLGLVVTPHLPLSRSPAAELDTIPTSIIQAEEGASIPSEPPLVLTPRPAGVAPATWESTASPPNLAPDFAPSTLRTWETSHSYRLSNEQVGGFAAFGAPLPWPPTDLSFRARVRKIGGPVGGGYGLFLRDVGAPRRDGSNQRGRFYVFEVSDRGEVSAWRRDEDHWLNLRPWLALPDVLSGNLENHIRVDAIGTRLAFFVNGAQAAELSDADALPGGVGVFVGGDQNVIELEGLAIDTPDSPDDRN